MKQHERLCRLANGDAPVYYVAPEFVRWMEYQRRAQDDTVLDRSAFIDCRDAPRPVDSDQHYICHRPRDSAARFFSEEPTNVRTVRGSQQLLGALTEMEPQFESFQDARSSFRELRRDLVELLGVESQVSPDSYSADGQAAWIHSQQRFFNEVVGVSLQFFETPS